MRDIGESVRDSVFRSTGRYSPRDDSGRTFNERISPARAAKLAGGVSNDEALAAAARIIFDEMEADQRVARGSLPAAARRLRGC